MAGKRPIRVMVVDDHELIRMGVRGLLEGAGGIVVCAEAGSVAEAIEAATTAQPDLVVVDLRLPGESGVDLIKQIMALRPKTQAVVMTAYADDREAILASIMAGASGCVLKEVECTQLIRAVREVAGGGAYLDPTTTKALLDHLREGGSLLENLHENKKLAQLSQTEMKVFSLMVQGKTDQQIGRVLGTAPKTIGHHLSKIYSKLGIAGRTQAIALLARVAEPNRFEGSEMPDSRKTPYR